MITHGIMHYASKSGLTGPPLSHLQNARATKDKLEMKRQESQEALLRDCTFAPRLNGVRGSGTFGTASSRADAAAAATNNTSRTLVFNDAASDVASDSPSRSDDAAGRSLPHPFHNARSNALDNSALSEFAALERELTDMLEATGSATQRLDHLKNNSKSGGGSGSYTAATLSGSLSSEPHDLRVIEEMLLHELHDPSKGGISYDAGLTSMVARLSSQGLEEGPGGGRAPGARSTGAAGGGATSLQHLAEELVGTSW